MELIPKKFKENIEKLIVYHGTSIKNIDNIKRNGLKSSVGYSSPKWYMVCTDIESAIFHSYLDENIKKSVVVKFSLSISNLKWVGFPYLWKPYIRNINSKWFALKQYLLKEFIVEIKFFSEKEYLKVKGSVL